MHAILLAFTLNGCFWRNGHIHPKAITGLQAWFAPIPWIFSGCASAMICVIGKKLTWRPCLVFHSHMLMDDLI